MAPKPTPVALTVNLLCTGVYAIYTSIQVYVHIKSVWIFYNYRKLNDCANIFICVYIQYPKAACVFMNNQDNTYARRLHMCLWINRHTYRIYVHMYVPWANDYIYLCLLMPFFINSIYSLVLFHNLALGYMLENVILYYMYIFFIWWWTSSHASSGVTHLTSIILVLHSR